MGSSGSLSRTVKQQFSQWPVDKHPRSDTDPLILVDMNRNTFTFVSVSTVNVQFMHLTLLKTSTRSVSILSFACAASQLKPRLRCERVKNLAEKHRLVLTLAVRWFKPRLIYFTSCCSVVLELCKKRFVI